jgi:hypothetical protein
MQASNEPGLGIVPNWSVLSEPVKFH